jgi:phage shock protein C
MKRLTLSRTDRKIAGVCGGIGEYFSVDPTLVRLGVVLLGLVTAVIPMLIAYLLAWFIIPAAQS